MSINLPTPENIVWQWDDTTPIGTRGRTVLETEEGDYFVFTANDLDKPVKLERIRTSGNPVWIRHLPDIQANSAALLLNSGKLYGALFFDIATGGYVFALNAISGGTLWEVRIEGIGPFLHSKYGNRIQLQFINNWLVVFGKESGGNYIEVYDPATGQRLYNRRVQQ